MVRADQTRVGPTGGKVPSAQGLASCEGERAKAAGKPTSPFPGPWPGPGVVSQSVASPHGPSSQERDAPLGAEPSWSPSPAAADEKRHKSSSPSLVQFQSQEESVEMGFWRGNLFSDTNVLD